MASAGNPTGTTLGSDDGAYSSSTAQSEDETAASCSRRQLSSSNDNSSILRAAPSSIELIKFERTGGDCYAVSWTDDGDVLCCVSGHGVQLRSGVDLNIMKTISIPPGRVYSAHYLSEQKLVIKVNSYGNTSTYIGTENDIQQNLIHEYKGHGSLIKVAGDRIADIDLGIKYIRMYTTAGEHLHKFDTNFLVDPTGLHLLADGVSVLISDNGRRDLRKYTLQGNEFALVWICSNLDTPTGIAVDEMGYIYVLSDDYERRKMKKKRAKKGKKPYQISSDGELLVPP